MCLALVGASCGGDDGGFAGSALTDEEFCSKITEMESLGSGETEADMAAAVAVIEDLATSAPT
ncbi:MAG: hypothetical protein EBY07_16595, partial [Actinobacteria bacterium]|nr:hypothetical protein [Actinomycetota bacterium]